VAGARARGDGVAPRERRGHDGAGGGACREGARGSGRTTLVQRLAWTLGVEGGAVVNEARGAAGRDVAARGGGDADGGVRRPRTWKGRGPCPRRGRSRPALDDAAKLVLSRASEGGAKLVVVGEESDLRPLAKGRTRAFVVPPLDARSAEELVHRAVPSLPDAIRPHLLERVEGRPGTLRAFLKKARGRAIVSAADIDAVFASSSAERGAVVEEPRGGARRDRRCAGPRSLRRSDDADRVVGAPRDDEERVRLAVGEARSRPRARGDPARGEAARRRGDRSEEDAPRARLDGGARADAPALRGVCAGARARGRGHRARNEGLNRTRSPRTRSACAGSRCRSRARTRPRSSDRAGGGGGARGRGQAGGRGRVRVAGDRASARRAGDGGEAGIRGVARSGGSRGGRLGLRGDAAEPRGARAVGGGLRGRARAPRGGGRHGAAAGGRERGAAGAPEPREPRPLPGALRAGERVDRAARDRPRAARGERARAAPRARGGARDARRGVRQRGRASTRTARLPTKRRGDRWTRRRRGSKGSSGGARDPMADLPQLARELDSLRKKAGADGFREHEALAQIARGTIALLSGDETAARAALDEALAHATRAAQREWAWRALDARARLSASQGSVATARRDTEQRSRCSRRRRRAPARSARGLLGRPAPPRAPASAHRDDPDAALVGPLVRNDPVLGAHVRADAHGVLGDDVDRRAAPGGGPPRAHLRDHARPRDRARHGSTARARDRSRDRAPRRRARLRGAHERGRRARGARGAESQRGRGRTRSSRDPSPRGSCARGSR
jgi:serine/threonine-protein kinase PknK